MVFGLFFIIFAAISRATGFWFLMFFFIVFGQKWKSLNNELKPMKPNKNIEKSHILFCLHKLASLLLSWLVHDEAIWEGM